MDRLVILSGFIVILSGFIISFWTSLVAQIVKRLSTMRETWVGKIPWRRKWQPNPLQYSCLENPPWTEEAGAGYCSWGHKESDMTE